MLEAVQESGKRVEQLVQAVVTARNLRAVLDQVSAPTPRAVDSGAAQEDARKRVISVGVLTSLAFAAIAYVRNAPKDS